jgi:hypothetical protein
LAPSTFVTAAAVEARSDAALAMLNMEMNQQVSQVGAAMQNETHGPKRHVGLLVNATLPTFSSATAAAAAARYFCYYCCFVSKRPSAAVTAAAAAECHHCLHCLWGVALLQLLQHLLLCCCALRLQTSQ